MNSFTKLCKMYDDDLCWHHFVAKAQSHYLAEIKENLEQNQCVIRLWTTLY